MHSSTRVPLEKTSCVILLFVTFIMIAKGARLRNGGDWKEDHSCEFSQEIYSSMGLEEVVGGVAAVVKTDFAISMRPGVHARIPNDMLWKQQQGKEVYPKSHRKNPQQDTQQVLTVVHCAVGYATYEKSSDFTSMSDTSENVSRRSCAGGSMSRSETSFEQNGASQSSFWKKRE